MQGLRRPLRFRSFRRQDIIQVETTTALQCDVVGHLVSSGAVQADQDNAFQARLLEFDELYQSPDLARSQDRRQRFAGLPGGQG